MNDKLLKRIKLSYPNGTRVRLVHMDDPRPVPVGTLGTVLDVDDIGSLIVSWDNGQSLNVLYGIDYVVKVEIDREGFIQGLYNYLRQGYNGYVFDSDEKAVPLSHDEVLSLMTSPTAKTDIDIFEDERHYHNLEPSVKLSREEIESVVKN
ncbi:TPA: DUF4314 domain-containing protein [Streptococcus agalactiae]|jgi:hypothetical protein|uniref:DUF4314 domain-containing protein n=2 Tax=Streptococcus TaxID=1301 RepID=G5KI03_9STRE|nr:MULTISPECIES: DUF4314 domain-containing protein [Streptococcus]QBX22195.1 hypothetical protein Javan639_0025 [Streptococcus phage Javan639]QBX22726.1 hypothetical protein Javan95_0018 [Streptococcus phage Javan95]EHJ57100.1 hypothetical protein STRUR_1588 [Streptococcus urinalis 2285-97]EIQ81395.1 hypothetical protein SCAZ3_03185 [Streptococcus canis FSL Z3-227]EKS16272.1 hypothetical protein HMPREF9318_02177 [Streptococcus urinalis FB127-CNA-2]